MLEKLKNYSSYKTNLWYTHTHISVRSDSTALVTQLSGLYTIIGALQILVFLQNFLGFPIKFSI